MKQGKVVICNIIMALISVAAIVTLIVGSFMKITVTLNIDGEKMAEIMDSQQGSGTGETQGVISSDEYYGNEDGFTDGETGGSYDDGDSANGGESSSSGMEELFKDINLSIPISLDFKSLDLIGSVIGDASEKMNAMLEREIGGIVDVLMNSMDKVLSGLVGVVVNQVVDKAEAEVKKQLESHGIIKQIGEDKIFYSEVEAIDFAKEELTNKAKRKHFWNKKNVGNSQSEEFTILFIRITDFSGIDFILYAL